MSTKVSHIGPTPSGHAGSNADNSQGGSQAGTTSSAAPRGGNHMKRLIFALGAAAGLLALGVPAAQASTHASGPTIVSVKPATGISNVASNGNGKLWTITLSNGARCYWEIGDHYMSNYTASGEADIKCPYAFTYTERVDLDYAYAVNGTNHYGGSSGWHYFYGAGGQYTDYWMKPGLCWPGSEPTLYWTTFAWIRFDGGTYKAWSQPDKKFEPAHC
jgi:hypothetical protein